MWIDFTQWQLVIWCNCTYDEYWILLLSQMKCCGVVNAKDWETNVTAPKWDPRLNSRLHFIFAIFDKSDTKKNRNVPLSLSTSLRSTANKPEGCCMWMMVDGKTEDISKDTDKIQVHAPSLLVIWFLFNRANVAEQCFFKVLGNFVDSVSGS